jgi:hypothetical protein
MARLTVFFDPLDEAFLYAERKEIEFPVREGTTEVLAIIQRMELFGYGGAQGRLDSGEEVNNRGAWIRLDVPLGQSHQWVDPAGGRNFFEADFHADHFTIMGQGMTDMAMHALTDDNVELWLRTRPDQEIRFREPPIVEDRRLDLDLRYFQDTSGFALGLRHRPRRGGRAGASP